VATSAFKGEVKSAAGLCVFCYGCEYSCYNKEMEEELNEGNKLSQLKSCVS